MKIVRVLVPAILVSVALACSGGTGATFSILDGVYDDAPEHGYDSPNGASTLGGGRSDGGTQPRVDSGTPTPARPFACGTVMQCTVSGAKIDLTYDCTLFRSDGKLVSKDGAEVGSWTGSGTTVTFVSKSADGGTTAAFVCIPKPATVDAGKDTGVAQ